jgi:hypothetical protein
MGRVVDFTSRGHFAPRNPSVTSADKPVTSADRLTQFSGTHRPSFSRNPRK